MSTVVQSTCPGCKQPLRIPADWLAQAIRCKHCGMVLQAKQKASGARPAAAPRTPVSPARAVQPPAAKGVPVAPPTAVPAAPAPVVAAPVAVVAAPAGGGSPFDMLDAGAADAAARPSRYRRKRGGPWWKGPAIALGVIVVAGLVTFFCWPYIREAFQVPAQPQASVNNDDHSPEVKYAPTADAPKSKDTSAKPNDSGGKTNTPTTLPKDTTTTKDPIKTTDTVKNAVYPRRALVISVHNYLYANPVGAGMPIAGARNIPHFLEALNKGLHVQMNEMAQLSDGAEKGHARAPMKPVIEKTLTDFLDSSRAQDRIMVFFVGHAVAISDKAYLAPIEGELDNADTLIPLDWVYEQMAKCKARQKVLVMDVNRLNPGHGLERPNGGPMDPKVDAALAAPPEGVQVWTACLAGQQSYEPDDAPMGAFLDALNTALAPGKNEKGLEGKIQRPDDPLPLDQLVPLVNSSMKEELSPYKLEQQSRLAGTEPKDGAAYDKAEAPAPPVQLASVGTTGDPKAIQNVLDEVGVPPIKASREDSGIHYEVLPPFSPEKLAAYTSAGEPTDEQKKLREAVLNAREVMWALNTAPAPPDIAPAVQEKRKKLSANLAILKDGYRKPADDAKFKAMVFKDEEEVADLMAACEDALAQLKGVGDMRDKENKRWQANYDFTLARLEAQYASLFEYDSMLGQMRKQAPDLAPGQNGWKLAAQETLKGDSTGKNLAKASRKLLDQVVKDNPGTPWEVLAKREKLTALGLQWQGAKVQ